MAIIDRIFSSNKDSLEISRPYSAEEEDCLSCRVLGSTALVSLGGYTYYSGMRELRNRKDIIERSASRYKYGSRQLGIVMLSAACMGAGVYRMIN